MTRSTSPNPLLPQLWQGLMAWEPRRLHLWQRVGVAIVLTLLAASVRWQWRWRPRQADVDLDVAELSDLEEVLVGEPEAEAAEAVGIEYTASQSGLLGEVHGDARCAARQYRGLVSGILTIEDTAELQLQQPHVVRLETRPPNIEGKGEVSQRALVRNSLRMRPDRIVVGEVRGAEVLEMLQAMNTGHDGSMATIHANSPRDCLYRIEMLAGFAGFQGSEDSLRRQIASAIDFIVQISRLGSGRRVLVSITEITGVSDNLITTQEMFRHEVQIDGSGKEIDRWIGLGFQPHSHKLEPFRQLLRESLYGDF